VSPLKALSRDIEKNLKEPLSEISELLMDKNGKELNIRVGVRTGDTSKKDRAEMSKKPPHILITTPESLAILLSSKKFITHLMDVNWLIIDEIHSLAENKRGVHLALLVEMLGHLSSHMTRIGLSATVSPLEEIANYLVGNKSLDGRVKKESNDCKIVNTQFIKKLDIKVITPVDDLVNSNFKDMHDKTYEKINDLVMKHKTTLIFTNTRAATERVVHFLSEKYPKNYYENADKLDNSENATSGIGAHHGSLSKEHRTRIENNLRLGKLKVIVCSTSLELGIDIGYIDLVICLGSPKSVARLLQRIGRSGHNLHDVTKGRVIVLDRDDLLECSVMVKSALEKKIDRIHIPKNSLDILAQVIFGFTFIKKWDENELYSIIKRCYNYSELKYSEYDEILNYLSGDFVSLEERYVYAKIWRKDGIIGPRGKMARPIYMTNLGTIPDQTGVIVKAGNQKIGTIDEGFLERLKKRDVFVLGGRTYQFKYSRGMVANVSSSAGKQPTVPSWYSEMLPLSFDLSQEISRFKFLIEEKLNREIDKNEIVDFVKEYLYCDEKSSKAIINYINEQFLFSKVPHHRRIVIEHYKDGKSKKAIFHTMYGRRVNDCLSRLLGYSISRSTHKDIEIAINDNGFVIGYEGKINFLSALKLIKSENIEKIMSNALDKSEILKRRFRHCATRSLMILRNYKGKTKRVGRQQVSSDILYNTVRRINDNFFLIKETKREVMQDLMDIDSTKKVIKNIENKKVKIEEFVTEIPSPFAFNLILQGFSDIIKMEDKNEFIKRMHNYVLAKISLGKKANKVTDFSYYKSWEEDEKEKLIQKENEENKKEKMLDLLIKVRNRISLDSGIYEDIVDFIKGKQKFPNYFIEYVKNIVNNPSEVWPKELIEYFEELLKRV
ncbi:MAG: ATP-dependent helicase, partial [Nanoarchaeota archaeon]